MLIDLGNFVNSKIICWEETFHCCMSLPCCASPKELSVHLACVLICTVVQKRSPSPSWAGNWWTYKLRVCVCTHAHASALQEGTNKNKKRSNLCLAMSRESLRAINSQSQSGRPCFRGWGEALWEPRSVVQVLAFSACWDGYWHFQPSVIRPQNHASQLLQGNCKELLCITV